MPVIPLSQLYPKIDEHPPKWVRSADGSRYEPDFSAYPEDAPRWSVSHIDPLTGFTMITLPTVETEGHEGVKADVVDAEPDTGTNETAEAAEAEAHPGAAPDAA